MDNLAARNISFPTGRQVDISQPASMPVSVADVKSWAQIDYDDHDAIIESLIKAIDNWLARQIGVFSTVRDVKVSFEAMGRNVTLDLYPISSIEEVKTVDMEGEETVLDEGDDYIVVRQDKSRLYMKNVDDSSQLVVILKCGTSQAQLVDTEISVFLRDSATAAYEARGQNVLTGDVVSKLPSFEGVMALSKARLI